MQKERAYFMLVGALWHVPHDAWTRNSPGSGILGNFGKTRLLSGYENSVRLGDQYVALFRKPIIYL